MSEDKVFVSFTCQRCSQSVKLDDSLHSFSEHISAELNRKLLIVFFFQHFCQVLSFLVPIHSSTDLDLESQTTSFDHYVPPCRLSDSRNGTSGFMLISDKNEVDLLSETFRVSFIILLTFLL